MRIPLFYIACGAAALCISGGCMGKTEADLPPPQMTVTRTVKPEQAKADAEKFLSQLERMPRPTRKGFVAGHPRGQAAIKFLKDPSLQSRLDADLAAK